MIKISTPFGIILKIFAIPDSTVLSGYMFSVKNSFFYLSGSSAAFTHPLLCMGSKYNLHHFVTISRATRKVKNWLIWQGTRDSLPKKGEQNQQTSYLGTPYFGAMGGYGSRAPIVKLRFDFQ